MPGNAPPAVVLKLLILGRACIHHASNCRPAMGGTEKGRTIVVDELRTLLVWWPDREEIKQLLSFIQTEVSSHV